MHVMRCEFDRYRFMLHLSVELVVDGDRRPLDPVNSPPRTGCTEKGHRVMGSGVRAQGLPYGQLLCEIILIAIC